MSTLIRNSNLFCDNCGGTFILKFPISVDDMGKKMEAFEALHSQCEKTWVEPEADQSLSWRARAEWWLQNGERGASSETIWNVMMGHPLLWADHPYDPDDFKRCWKLLKAVPEWRERMTEMCGVSMGWDNLVQHWEQLESMYERREEEGVSEQMYALMQTLIGR